jgi:hypothetical protein
VSSDALRAGRRVLELHLDTAADDPFECQAITGGSRVTVAVGSQSGHACHQTNPLECSRPAEAAPGAALAVISGSLSGAAGTVAGMGIGSLVAGTRARRVQRGVRRYTACRRPGQSHLLLCVSTVGRGSTRGGHLITLAAQRASTPSLTAHHWVTFQQVSTGMNR